MASWIAETVGVVASPDDASTIRGRCPREEDLAGGPLREGQPGSDVDDRPEFLVGLDRIHTDAPLAVAYVELCALPGRAREAFEGRMRQFAERQLPPGRRGETEEAWTERVAAPAHVEEEAVVLERPHHAVRGRARHPGGVPDRRRGQRAPASTASRTATARSSTPTAVVGVGRTAGRFARTRSRSSTANAQRVSSLARGMSATILVPISGYPSHYMGSPNASQPVEEIAR